MWQRATLGAGIILLVATGCRSTLPYGLVTTLAGHSRGMLDGDGVAASFDQPGGIAEGADGTIYVADTFNHRVRALTPDGVVTTLAGGGLPGMHGGGYVDGPGLTARFRFPRDIAADGLGHLFVADTNNSCVRMIDLLDPAHPVTTLAGKLRGYQDGPGHTARFLFPWGIAVGGANPAKPDVYVSDTYNYRIRRVDLSDPAHGVTTIAGSGLGLERSGYADGAATTVAKFGGPRGLAVAWQGSQPSIYVADSANQAIRRIDMSDPTHAQVSTLGGTRTKATHLADLEPLIYPTGVILDRRDPARLALFAVDSADGTIYHMTADGRTTWLVGGGLSGAADGFWRGGQFQGPNGIVEDARGRLLIADTGNDRIRVVI